LTQRLQSLPISKRLHPTAFARIFGTFKSAFYDNISYLCLVKKVAFILSVFTLLLVIFPCCLADNCFGEDDITERTNHKETGTAPNCELCSPFFSCHNCPGFTYTLSSPKLILIFFPNTERYLAYFQDFVSTFAPSIWQPPKIASSIF